MVIDKIKTVPQEPVTPSDRLSTLEKRKNMQKKL